jgi:hypothetical protein
MIGTDDLTKEDPKSYQRGIDAIVPARADCFQGWSDSFFGKNAGERQVSLLCKLTPQETDLLPNWSLITIAHP